MVSEPRNRHLRDARHSRHAPHAMHAAVIPMLTADPWPQGCSSTEHELAHLLGAAGTPWDACPRSALKKVLAKAQRDHGITFSIGYESEFILLQRPTSDHSHVPPGIDRSVYCSSRAYNDAAPGESFLCMSCFLPEQSRPLASGAWRVPSRARQAGPFASVHYWTSAHAFPYISYHHECTPCMSRT